MKLTSFVDYIKAVRSESYRVTWPLAKDVKSSSFLVLTIIIIASLFFLAIDTAVYGIIDFILNFGG